MNAEVFIEPCAFLSLPSAISLKIKQRTTTMSDEPQSQSLLYQSSDGATRLEARLEKRDDLAVTEPDGRAFQRDIVCHIQAD